MNKRHIAIVLVNGGIGNAVLGINSKRGDSATEFRAIYNRRRRFFGKIDNFDTASIISKCRSRSFVLTSGGHIEFAFNKSHCRRIHLCKPNRIEQSTVIELVHSEETRIRITCRPASHSTAEQSKQRIAAHFKINNVRKLSFSLCEVIRLNGLGHLAIRNSNLHNLVRAFQANPNFGITRLHDITRIVVRFKRLLPFNFLILLVNQHDIVCTISFKNKKIFTGTNDLGILIQLYRFRRNLAIYNPAEFASHVIGAEDIRCHHFFARR